MPFKPDSSSISPESAQPRATQYLESTVPTPFFSGSGSLTDITAISFAPKTIEFATPITSGTLISDFNADPHVLRDCDDTFPSEDFVELVITWPGLDWEWKAPMSNIVGDRNHISRKELAQFVVKHFDSFARFMSAKSWPDSEWRLGEAPCAYDTKNTCLLFLFSPAPRVWQPAFRVKNRFYDSKGLLSVPEGAPDPPPFNIPPGAVLHHVVQGGAEMAG